MAEQQTATTAAGVAAAVAPDIDAITKKASDDGFAAAGQIAAVCAIAGKPERASGFIAERKTVAEVSTLLMAEKVAEDKKAEIDPNVLLRNEKSKETAELGKPKPWKDVIGEITARAFGQKGGK